MAAIRQAAARYRVYVRFVIQDVDPDSRRKRGILVAAGELHDEGDLEPHERQLVRALCDWFNEHLRVPAVLKDYDSIRAISWFKSEAEKPIAKMWELVHVLRAHGINVEFLKADDPGNVIYEDEWQVVATPHKGVRRPW